MGIGWQDYRLRVAEGERRLLSDGNGSLDPDRGGSFPDISLAPELGNSTGPLLHTGMAKRPGLQSAHRKTSLQAINWHKLGSRTDRMENG